MTEDAFAEVRAAIEGMGAGMAVAIVDDGNRTTLAAAVDVLTPDAIAEMRGRDRERGLTLVAAPQVEQSGPSEPSLAAVELAGLAGKRPVAVVCVVALGTGRDLRSRLPTVSASAVLRYRARVRISRMVETTMPTPGGERLAVGYRSEDGREHLAIVKGSVAGTQGVFVAVCPQCTAGHVLHSTACGCGPHLAAALEELDRQDRGVVVHLTREPGASIELGSLDASGAACAARRRASVDDPTTGAILDDLAPGTVRMLDADAVPLDPAAPGLDLVLSA